MASINPLGVLSDRANSIPSRRARPAILSRKRKAEEPLERPQPAPPQPMCSPNLDIVCFEELPELSNIQNILQLGSENHAPNCQEPNLQPVRHSLAKSVSSSSQERLPLASLSTISSSTKKPVAEAISALSSKKIRMKKSWSQFRAFIHSKPSRNASRTGSPTSSPLRTDLASPSIERGSTPFPPLRWADRDEMWHLVCKKETGMYVRKSACEIQAQNPAIVPKMRAILLDWLIEVCEVYKLHRETFYLTVDFIDRYLSSTEDMPKTRLQLIGVTCLFIGSKIEEIYPPKLSDFAYVTDGACSEEEILSMELVILKHLNWGLSPMTPNSWMKLFMQLSNCDSMSDSNTFITAQYSGLPFSRVMQLIDLCILDMGSLSFRYSVLATAALAHMMDRDVALHVSGYKWHEVSTCVEWMSAFVLALREENVPPVKSFHNIPAENAHNIQVHTVDLTTLDRAQECMAELKSRKSPEPRANATFLKEVLLTPPDDDNSVTTTTSESGISRHMQIMKQQQHTPKSKMLSSRENNSVFLSPQTPSTSSCATEHYM